jgi:hypothetical protein
MGLWIFMGNGDGTFNAPVGFLNGSWDFNGDGKPDLAVAGTGVSLSGDVAVLTNSTP